MRAGLPESPGLGLSRSSGSERDKEENRRTSELGRKSREKKRPKETAVTGSAAGSAAGSITASLRPALRGAPSSAWSPAQAVACVGRRASLSPRVGLGPVPALPLCSHSHCDIRQLKRRDSGAVVVNYYGTNILGYLPERKENL